MADGCSTQRTLRTRTRQGVSGAVPAAAGGQGRGGGAGGAAEPHVAGGAGAAAPRQGAGEQNTRAAHARGDAGGELGHAARQGRSTCERRASYGDGAGCVSCLRVRVCVCMCTHGLVVVVSVRKWRGRRAGGKQGLTRSPYAFGLGQIQTRKERVQRHHPPNPTHACSTPTLHLQAKREAEHRAEEEAFRAASLASFAEDARNAALTQQARRYRMAEYRRGVEEQVTARRAMYEQQLVSVKCSLGACQAGWLHSGDMSRWLVCRRVPCFNGQGSICYLYVR